MFRVLIPLTISIAIIGLLAYSIDTVLLLEAMRNISPLYLVVVVCVLCIGHAIAILRWKILLDATGSRIPFKDLAKIYSANIPLARWIPLYGGDLMRVFFMRNKVATGKGAGIIITEAILDIETLLLLSLLGSIFFLNLNFALVAFAGICTSVIFLWCVKNNYFSRIVSLGFIKKIENELIVSPTILMRASIPTFAMWLTVIIGTLYCFRAFGVPISLLQIITMQPLVVLISLLPVTLGGLGTREWVMLAFYAGIESPELVLMSGFAYSVVSVFLIPLLASPISYYVWQQVIDKKL